MPHAVETCKQYLLASELLAAQHFAGKLYRRPSGYAFA